MNSPICVSDTFHYSHYYWKSWGADFDSDVESEYDESDEVYIPKPVKTDTVKLKFHSQVMGDGSNNIHFGKWDNIDQDRAGAYGRASEQMTDYMFNLAMSLVPHRRGEQDFSYVDLGSGRAAPAVHLMEKHQFIRKASCLNLCHDQNILAQQNVNERNLKNRMQIVEGHFEHTPFQDNAFDMAFSQDAFVHAFSKVRAYTEAYRITKPGGAVVICDLMCGDNPDLTGKELEEFAKSNAVNDWLTPSNNVKAFQDAGWRDVKFIDLTTDVRISFQLMLKKVTFILEHGDTGSNMNRVLLMNYRDSICRRIAQVDRGVFKWGVIHARKPVFLKLACKPPVPLVNTNHLIDTEEHDVESKTKTNVVVIDILQKMNKERIEALPPTVNLLVTMSAGLDHIDMDACAARGIAVKQSGRDAITSHVVQYSLSFIILALRDALNQLSVPFPSSGWNLNWNCEGKPLTSATIAIVGLGVIATRLIEEIRKLAPHTRIIYYVPENFRNFSAESNLRLEYVSEVEDLAAECDVLVPMCPLNKFTKNIISRDVIAKLKPHAGLVNMARGGIVDTDALTDALQRRAIKYAILDTTCPEPLPKDHPLWSTKNCFIFPHYATNTMAVREALVNEIQPIVEDHFGLGNSDKKKKAEENALRFDLAVAHRLTAKYKMDMLVWNHISARFRSGCLITPGRKMWSKIKPDDLVYSSSNVTADIIHDAIYAARPDIKAIIHLHTPAATAVSCLEGGFQALTQDSAYFYKKVANYDWDGLSDDASEGPAITAAVRSVEGCNTLLMHNHGYVCFGSSVREAWVLAYYFERCCEVQLNVMKCGGRVKLPPKAVMEKAAESSYLPEFAPGVCEWDALCEEVSFD